MKIYAFKVVPTEEWTHAVEKALILYDQAPLSERIRDLGGIKLRLESYKASDRLHYANFTLFRTGSGPAIASPTKPLSEIDIQEEEYFGEDTACLYDPESRYILIQYNHRGPKASAIQEYLSHEDGEHTHSYLFAPKLSPSSEEQIRNLRVVSRLEVSLAVPDLVNAAKQSSLSVASAINLGRSNGAELLSLAMSNRRGLTMGAIKELVTSFINSDPEEMGIRRLKVKAQLDEESPRETIDLIAERLCATMEIRLSSGRRYSLSDRWECLKNIHQNWLKQGLLT